MAKDILYISRCPNCGAPVPPSKAGETIICSYCGTPLRAAPAVSLPVAPLSASITTYLVRTENRRRLREQLAEVEERLAQLRQTRAQKVREIKETSQQPLLPKAARSKAAIIALFFLCLLASPLGYFQKDAGGAAVLLFFMGALVLSPFFLIAAMNRWKKEKRLKALRNALAEIDAQGKQLAAHREEMAKRLAALEAELEELEKNL